MLRVASAVLIASLVLSAGCSLFSPEPEPLLFAEMGDWRPAATADAATLTDATPAARPWFEQGLKFYWGFNHGEAALSFAKAAEIDPSCALAHAYVALCHGPNINDPDMNEERSRLADEAVSRAVARCPGKGDRTRMLVEAIRTRFAWPPPADRAELNRAYADAMAAVHARFPDDAEIGTLYADACLNVSPWNQWTKDGQPKEGTLEAVRSLEHAIACDEHHPGANHLLIHAVEASPDPGRAKAAADRLRSLVPGIAHLRHMPSHIDIRLGHYDDAVAANQRAVAADKAYLAVRPRRGIYAMYGAHNRHFLAYAAMFAGRRADALEAAQAMEERLSLSVVRELPDVLDAFLGIRDEVFVRFGLWDDVLARELPPDDLPVTMALRRYARGVALAALGRPDEAKGEVLEFESALARIPATAMIGNNPASTVMEIGHQILLGEVAYRAGDFEPAFEHLRDAVRRDDELRYDEPWGWMMPARHALGALLLEQGRLEEARDVYRADLAIHPENGWALHGLAEALGRLGANEEAAAVRARFAKSWQHADIEIGASCYCRTGAMAGAH